MRSWSKANSKQRMIYIKRPVSVVSMPIPVYVLWWYMFYGGICSMVVYVLWWYMFHGGISAVIHCFIQKFMLGGFSFIKLLNLSLKGFQLCKAG